MFLLKIFHKFFVLRSIQVDSEKTPMRFTSNSIIDRDVIELANRHARATPLPKIQHTSKQKPTTQGYILILKDELFWMDLLQHSS